MIRDKDRENDPLAYVTSYAVEVLCRSALAVHQSHRVYKSPKEIRVKPVSWDELLTYAEVLHRQLAELLEFEAMIPSLQTLSMANPYPVRYREFASGSYAELIIIQSQHLLSHLDKENPFSGDRYNFDLELECYKEYQRAANKPHPRSIRVVGMTATIPVYLETSLPEFGEEVDGLVPIKFGHWMFFQDPEAAELIQKAVEHYLRNEKIPSRTFRSLKKLIEKLHPVLQPRIKIGSKGTRWAPPESTNKSS